MLLSQPLQIACEGTKTNGKRHEYGNIYQTLIREVNAVRRSARRSAPLPFGSACDDGDPCTTNDMMFRSGCKGMLRLCSSASCCRKECDFGTRINPDEVPRIDTGSGQTYRVVKNRLDLTMVSGTERRYVENLATKLKGVIVEQYLNDAVYQIRLEVDTLSQLKKFRKIVEKDPRVQKVRFAYPPQPHR